jgi:TonB family protein
MKLTTCVVTASGILVLSSFGWSAAVACEPSLAILPSPTVIVATPRLQVSHAGVKSDLRNSRNRAGWWTPDTSGPPPAAVGKYEPFMNNLQNKLKSVWTPPDNVSYSPAEFEFAVSKDGKISKIKRLRSSGYAAADDAAWLALLRASPVSSLPAGSPSTLRVQFIFESSTGSTCCCGGSVCTCAKPNSCGRN